MENDADSNVTFSMTTDPTFDDVTRSAVRYEDIPAFRYSVYVRVASTIILVPTATVGNILSFIVMQSKHLKGCTSLYLSYLAVADLLTIYSVCLPDTVAKATGYFLTNVSGFMCTYYTFNRQFLIELTSWILVLVAIERAISVCFPTRARNAFNYRNSVIIALVTTAALLALNLRHAWTRRLQGRACRPLPQHLYVEGTIFPYVIRSVFWIVPTILMTICNISIVIRLRVLSFKVKRTRSKVNSNTVIMVLTTVAFCVLTSPQTLFYQFNPGWNYAPPEQKAKFELGYAICQMMGYVNNTINFFLYVASGPRFRREFMRIFGIKASAVAPTDVPSVTGQVEEQNGTSSSRERQFSRTSDGPRPSPSPSNPSRETTLGTAVA